MLESIREKDQIHGLLLVIVLGEEEFKFLFDFLDFTKIFVKTWVFCFFTGLAESKVSKEER